jgi:hypothetical protein
MLALTETSYMSSIQSELANLRVRIQRLEDAQPSRGWVNLAGAARHLGVSDEALRQRHLRGEGPKRSRNGRQWSYRIADLDEYAATRS